MEGTIFSGFNYKFYYKKMKETTISGFNCKALFVLEGLKLRDALYSNKI
jgi:hypothetical protein